MEADARRVGFTTRTAGAGGTASHPEPGPNGAPHGAPPNVVVLNTVFADQLVRV